MDKPSYQAFISYRHADNRESGRCWASWLHRALETYRVPPELVGTTNLRGGPIPERIYPVFRDEEEFLAEAALAQPPWAVHQGHEIPAAVVRAPVRHAPISSPQEPSAPRRSPNRSVTSQPNALSRWL